MRSMQLVEAWIGLVLFVIYLPGCQNPVQERPTLPQARAALVKLVEGTDNSLLRLSLPSLQNDEAILQEGLECVGPWRIDLVNHRFWFQVHSEDFLAEYTGVFEQLGPGKWIARIIGSTET